MRNLIKLIVLLFLVSCDQSNELKIRFDNVDGLNTESQVLVNGWEVGRIKKIGLDKESNIIVTINVDKEIILSTDSKFELTKTDFLGSMGIIIKPGNSGEVIAFGDTINGTKGNSGIPETIESTTLEIIQSIKDFQSVQDSILTQLKILNEKLDK